MAISSLEYMEIMQVLTAIRNDLSELKGDVSGLKGMERRILKTIDVFKTDTKKQLEYIRKDLQTKLKIEPTSTEGSGIRVETE